ncbi:MAG: TonB-dependent receptor [Gammaproteobacteria bacterium]|nr:TonB-dependent receptor [Gammaproteobacteria bacterium]
MRILLALCAFFVFINSSLAVVEKIPDVTILPASRGGSYKASSTTTAPVKVIMSKTIKKSGAHNLEQVLIAQGLDVRDLEGDGSKTVVSMRGFGQNARSNTLIMLNGMPLTNPDLGTFNINQIPLATVQKIEVLAGSAGVLYGDQAVGGVINIITKRAQKNKEVAVGYGSYGLQQYRMALATTKNRTSYSVNLNYLRTNNYRDHNKSRTANIAVALEHALNGGDFSVRYFLNQEYLQYPGALTAAEVQHNRRQSPSSSSGDFDSSYDHTLLANYTHRIGMNWQLKLLGSLRGMLAYGHLAAPYNRNRYALDFTPTMQGIINIGERSLFTVFGAKLSQGQYRFNSSGYASRAERQVYAAFSQVTLPVKRLNFIAGVRVAGAHSEQELNSVGNSGIDYALISNLEMSVQLTHDFKWFARRAGSYRFPTTDENINTKTGKPLKAQTGVSYETGLLFIQQKFSGHFTLFDLNLKNEIADVPTVGGSTLVVNDNLDPTRRLGFSLDGGYKVNKYLQLNAIYHYVHGVFSAGPDVGNRIPFVADNNFVFSTTVTPIQRLKLYFEAIYTGAKSLGDDPEQRSALLGGYTVYNIAASYKYKNIELNFRVNNITNKYYFAYAFDVYTGSGSGDKTPYYYPAPGINFLCNITVRI